MAHSDAKSTRIYTENHIEWICVPHGEILIKNKEYYQYQVNSRE